MKSGDQQLGSPGVPYKDAKSNIAALASIAEGAFAYATDTDELGYFDGVAWNWGDLSGGTGVIIISYVTDSLAAIVTMKNYRRNRQMGLVSEMT